MAEAAMAEAVKAVEMVVVTAGETAGETVAEAMAEAAMAEAVKAVEMVVVTAAAAAARAEAARAEAAMGMEYDLSASQNSSSGRSISPHS
jgi:CO dehydrogenase/acetyl-CoA synthase gamma subunit (corrinoid Fe-S protein)